MHKFKVILATSKNHILGNNNSIPWLGKYPKDLQYFKKITSFSPLDNQNIVIMGRKTWESLPLNKLPNRIPIVISTTLKANSDYYLANSFEKALQLCDIIPHNEVFVIGGQSIYQQAFNHNQCGEIYHTIINKDYQGDTQLEIVNPRILSEYTDGDLTFRKMKLQGEVKYLRLLSKILNTGEKRQTRNAITYSLFDEKLEFDLQDGFPLLTTKRMFWKGIVEELLFFIRGQTDSKLLEEKGVNIWKGNTSKEFIEKYGLPYREGDMGEIYGYNWRHFGAEYQGCDEDYTGKGFDQLTKVIEEIKTNPTSRRIIMTDFNPSTAHKGVLYPCHSLLLQFYVREGNILDIKMFQRSSDFFLGEPFNISSTSLLLCIIAKLTNKIPGKVTLTLGDCHIYDNHIEQVKRQLGRLPYKFPLLKIPEFKTLEEVENSKLEDYVIENYICYKGIKAEMVA